MKTPLVLFLLLIASPLLAQDPPSGVLADIGIDQKLNTSLPLDLIFKDESGKSVPLERFFHKKPVVLSLVYYECPMLCSMTLNGLVKSMRAMPFRIGDEFEVLTISFDPNEKPELAAAKKQVYVGDYGRPDGAEGWHFLTGSKESIERLTETVGYRYKWDNVTKQWAHASAIMVVTPEGRLSQYLYGIEFSSRDLRLSLVQASQNKIGNVVDRILLFCYHYNPDTGKYGLVVMNTVRLASIATVVALATFIVVSRRRGA